MKFNLHGRRSMAAQKKHAPLNTALVQSWKDLRVIGSQDAYRRLTEATHDASSTSLQDEHDWNLYISQFNEQYRQRLRRRARDKETDSISTAEETRSELLKNRQRRLTMYRKLFITMCLILWALYCYLLHQWNLFYLVYPGYFLDFKDKDIFTDMFTPEWKFKVFLLYQHVWVVGSFGIMCATCFRETPCVLRQFILRVPYVLLIPMFFIFGGVNFTGALSVHKLGVVMDEALSGYYDPENKKINETRLAWSKLQSILACCGINGPADWHTVDIDLNDVNSTIPESCCPKKFFRDAYKGGHPPRDDCGNKIDADGTKNYEWAYPDGCLNKAQEFYVKIGAHSVAVMFAIFVVMCLCLIFGKQYYTVLRKTIDLRYKYDCKQWIYDITFISWVLQIKVWIVTLIFAQCGICQSYVKEDATARRRRKRALAKGRIGEGKVPGERKDSDDKGDSEEKGYDALRRFSGVFGGLGGLGGMRGRYYGGEFEERRDSEEEEDEDDDEEEEEAGLYHHLGKLFRADPNAPVSYRKDRETDIEAAIAGTDIGATSAGTDIGATSAGTDIGATSAGRNSVTTILYPRDDDALESADADGTFP